MTEQENITPEKQRHERFMREMDEFERKMDDDFRRINHLSDSADINQILAGVQDADDIRQEKELDELEANIIKNRRYIKNPDDYLQQIARIRNKG